MGQKNVSEFWEVVGGLQLVVVQDGVSAGHGDGFGGGTDLGAVSGSGSAKEGSEPGVFLAVGGRGKRGGMREVYRLWFGCVVEMVLVQTCTTYSHPYMKEIVQVWTILATRVMLSGGVLPWRWRRTSSFGRPAGLQHAHLVLRPIERSLRAARGWGVACASSKSPGRKSVVGPCSGRLGQLPPAAVGSGQAKICL